MEHRKLQQAPKDGAAAAGRAREGADGGAHAGRPRAEPPGAERERRQDEIDAWWRQALQAERRRRREEEEERRRGIGKCTLLGRELDGHKRRAGNGSDYGTAAQEAKARVAEAEESPSGGGALEG